MTWDICDEEKIDNANEELDRVKALNAQLLETLMGAAHTMESVAREVNTQSAFILTNYAVRARATIADATYTAATKAPA